MSAAAIPEDDDILAGEWALGVLEPAEAGAVALRAAAEPALAARAQWWSEHFAELLDLIALPPREDVWARIVAALPANDDALRATLRRWRMAAGFGFTVAAGLGAALLLRPQPPVPVAPPPVAELLASLDGKDGHVATVAWNPAERRLTIAPGKIPADGRVPELWIIPGDGTPRSLGVIDGAHRSLASVQADRAGFIHEGMTFAISLEPAGGSPTGLPTGPVIATGTIS